MVNHKNERFHRVSKKQKTAPVSEDDFLEAVDHEEAAGGKHRVGDKVKSARAYQRAIQHYDDGLTHHPRSFDLAYNKARLFFHLSQNPAIVQEFGVDLLSWFRQTHDAHQYAAALKDDNPDLWFNFAQTCHSTAELFVEQDRDVEALPMLEQSVELFDKCFALQKSLYHQHQQNLTEWQQDQEQGGVSLNPDVASTSEGGKDEDTAMTESVTVETAVTPHDLLDTILATLAAFTTLVDIAGRPRRSSLADQAIRLAEIDTPPVIALLPVGPVQDSAKFAVGLDYAGFQTGFAIAHFADGQMDLERCWSLVEDKFKALMPIGGEPSTIWCAEAVARMELAKNALELHGLTSSPFFITQKLRLLLWQHVTKAQELLKQTVMALSQPKIAVNVESEEELIQGSSSAPPAHVELCILRGDTEFLRYRLATNAAAAWVHVAATTSPEATASLQENINIIGRGAPMLMRNAQTFYRGAEKLARQENRADLVEEAKGKFSVAALIAEFLENADPVPLDIDLGNLSLAMASCTRDELIDSETENILRSRLGGLQRV